MEIENPTPTIQANGSAGINTVVNTPVVTLALPTAGVYKVWGMVRHTLIDGLKITSPASAAIGLTSAANDTATFGPMFVMTPTPGNFVIQLATATGAADTASATVFAQRLQ
jgi:hypothetical protein